LRSSLLALHLHSVRQHNHVTANHLYHLNIEYFYSIIILIPLLKNVLDGLSTYGSYGFQIPNNDENILGKNLH